MKPPAFIPTWRSAATTGFRTAVVRSCLTLAVFSAVLVTMALLRSEPVETAAATSCENLATLVLPDATMTSAQLVAAGAFTPPGGRGGTGGRGAPAGRGRGAGAVYATLPAFCRVSATLTPTTDSDIKIEVWLPASGWNGKLQAVGNGGWAGTISYAALAAAVAGGYAGASTDTGHMGNDAEFALGHPEKLIDFAYRSVHEMTVKAKALVEAHYGTAPKLSYWNGCSQGGRQGLAEAQRYPADFDGIVAGASAVDAMHLHAGRIAANQIVNKTPASAIPASKYLMIHNEMLKACDALDGVQDRVLENPARCRFDPKVLLCNDADGPACLTAAQVESARALYAPVKHPKTGKTIYPGLRPGSELGWGVVGGPEPIGTALQAFRFVVFSDPSWDWRRFDLSTDVDHADKMDNGVLSTNDSNLKPFFDRGGKLLMYHGWNDPQVPPDNSVIYFNNVVSRLGKGVVGKSIQLFMVPGMNHCQGGAGTDTFDKMAAIEQWVEKGTAPDQILASHRTDGKVDRTRPLCPFGKVAKWKGTGSTDDAANFTCVAE